MSSADVAVARPEAAVEPMRYPGTLARQYLSEVALVFRRKRNIAMLLILAVVPILIGTAVKLSSPQPGQGPPLISQLTDNGLFLAFAALTICLPVFLPLAVAVVAGDAVAGEANIGTLRYLLTVPVSRTRVLVVKSLGALTYTLAAIVLVTLVGMVFGVAIFGSHGVTLLSGDTVSFANGLARSVGVAGYVFVDLLGLAALAIFFSTLTEVPIGAMAATVVVAIIFAVLDSVPQLGSFRSLLLSHHWLDYDELLRSSVSARTLLHGMLIPACYAAIFGSLAWARISNADVTA